MAKDVIKKPLNIWNDCERLWVMQLNFVFEGQTLTGIGNSDFEDVVKDLDWLIKKITLYRNEMNLIYNSKKKVKSKSTIATHVYLLYCINTGLYKIGRSINPTFREKTIGSEQPNIEMVFSSPITDKGSEKELHKMFSSKRVRGEWFRLDSSDILTIKNYPYGID